MSLLTKLNEKGQCPECKKKPRPYKRHGYLACLRCDRAYDPDTGWQIDNWAWENGEPRNDLGLGWGA